MRYVASIDTLIYDVPYVAGQEVDVTGWNRQQELQYLGNGLMAPMVEASSNAQVYLQPVPSTIWDVYHSLPFTPSVLITDASGDVVFGDIDVLNTTHVRVSFSAPFSGSVYLS
jgi:hypothetical protein